MLTAPNRASKQDLHNFSHCVQQQTSQLFPGRSSSDMSAGNSGGLRNRVFMTSYLSPPGEVLLVEDVPIEEFMSTAVAGFPVAASHNPFMKAVAIHLWGWLSSLFLNQLHERTWSEANERQS